MTDLEMTKLCAEAMGFQDIGSIGELCSVKDGFQRCKAYRPLHDDAQAMALVKKLHLACMHHIQPPDEVWEVVSQSERGASVDLNRAIVECVAKMQLATHVGSHSETGIANNG